MENRRTEAAGLLGGLDEDSLPAGEAFSCGGDQSFLAAGGGERDDFGHAEFRGFFERPFEAIEPDDGEEQGEMERVGSGGKLLDEGELHGGFGNTLDASEPES